MSAPAAADDAPLHPVVAAFARHIAVNGDKHIELPAEAFGDAVEACVALQGDERERAAHSIIALALRADREGREAAQPLLGQLALLVALLLGPASGVPLPLPFQGDAREAIGAAASKIPVGAQGRVAGALSPFQLRLGHTPADPE